MPTIENTVLWPLIPGDSINRWHISAAHREPFAGIARLMPDKVDYQFVNGWVDTGDLPCREALHPYVEQRVIQPSISTMAIPARSEAYIGGEDPRVDFSTFCFTPTLITRWAEASLYCAEEVEAEFSLETCGGAHLWVDGEHAAEHEPYTRNQSSRRTLTLELSAGEHQLLIRFDDLHERDTHCFFRLELLHGNGLSAGLQTGVSLQRLQAADHLLNTLRTERLFHQGEPIVITADQLADEPIQLDMKIAAAFTGAGKVALPGHSGPYSSDSVLGSDGSDHADQNAKVTLSRSSPTASFYPPATLPAGCVLLHVSLVLEDLTLQRKLGTTLLPAPLMLDTTASLEERKQAVLPRVAEHGQAGPSKALVILATTTSDRQIAEAISLLHGSLHVVNERHDCADFQLMPLLWIWLRYRDRLPASDRALLRGALLNFRYWLDEPGNDVMWFWSENHVLCFHVAQYLAGHHFADEILVNSGLSGCQRSQEASMRLHQWFDAIDEHGLGEWNSAAYYPIDLIGLLTLYEFAPDAALSKRARQVCDRIFIMTALHLHGGVPAGSEGRSYEKELLSGPANELGSVAAVAFGGPWYPGHDRATVLLALGRYEPPSSSARYLTLNPAETLNTQYAQGHGKLGRLHLWKARHAQLSTVVDHASGNPGHQQHLVDLQLAAHPMARCWVNHPGELRVWGDGRPSYWAGNGTLPRLAQYASCALLLYDLPRSAVAPFTHLLCPIDAMDEVHADEHWLFARAGDGYLSAYAAKPLGAMSSGLYARSEWRQAGLQHGWILIAGSADLHGSFRTFQQDCRRMQPRYDAQGRGEWRLAHPDGELLLQFQEPLLLDQQPCISQRYETHGYQQVTISAGNEV